MPTQSSRRAPWPYDVRIAEAIPFEPGGEVGSFRGTPISDMGVPIGTLRPRRRGYGSTFGLMLMAQQGSGLLVGKKQTSLANLYPSEAEYGSAPVYRERTFAFRPTGGMGERIQKSATDRRYHYGLDVWVTGGLFGKGPLVHPLVPAATGPIRRFAEGLDATGQPGLFVLAGGRILQVQGDTDATQVVIHTRAGFTATDAVRFQGGYAGAVDALYVAWTDGLLEEYAGGVWTACALPAGFGVQRLEKVGDELWGADAGRSVLRKVTADPKVAANWSGPIQIGDPSAALGGGITAIRQTSNVLCVFKADGTVYTFNSDGTDNDLFPGLRMPPAGDNGRTAVAWLNALWFRAGRAFFKLEMPSATLTPVGPGRMLSNTSPVRGPVQCFAGWNTQMGFAGIYNETDHVSYLLSYGNWSPVPGDQGTGFAFVDQYDGALAHWVAKRITALWITGVRNAPDTRLYAGFDDGTYEWLKLVSFPLAPDGGAEFTTGISEIVLPVHHAMFQSDRKHWPGFSLYGPIFAPGDVVEVFYRVGATSTGPGVTATGDWIKAPDAFIHNGQRIVLPPNVAGIAIGVKLRISSASNFHTPVLETLGIHERLVPQFRRDFSMTVDANDVVARRDGASVRQSGRQVRDRLMDAAAAPASINLQFPDETLSSLAIFDYTERMVPHSARGGQGWAIDIQCTQFGISEIFGIIKRLRGTTIGDLRGFTVGSLRTL